MSAFGTIDWLIVGAYFALVTLIGHRLSARQVNVGEYFLGSRSLPWWTVSASIVSTTVSGVTFIGVPAIVFAEGGDFRYLQFCLAGFISKWIFGHWILPKLYAGAYSSPYDYIRDRLGAGLGQLSALLFFVGAVLSQGVRIYAVALVLELLTGLDFAWCVSLSVGVAVASTWLGGVRAVVWTDVVQFLMLIAGGCVAIAFISQDYPGGFASLLSAAGEAGKLRLLDLSLDPLVSYTIWAGVFAMPFQNLAAYGADQLNTQRMLCCRSISEARRALYVSNIGEGVVLLFLLAGVALWGFYTREPLDPRFAALVAETNDRIFPAFILSEMPAGLRGFMVAAIFAAAMSSPVLSALAETSLTMFHRGHRTGSLSDADAVVLSRTLVALWGVALAGFAIMLRGTDEGLIPLAFAMTSYTYGGLLGLFLMAAFIPRRHVRRPLLGVVASALTVVLVDNVSALGWSETGKILAFPWLFPLGLAVCLGVSLAPFGPLKNPLDPDKPEDPDRLRGAS
jgi:SSS family transporter